ncbi:MAG: mandelate racemase/muconate lactonizing enzyme family protein [Chloroflexota bacterium]
MTDIDTQARIDTVQAVDVTLPYDPPFRSAWQPHLEQRSRPMTFAKLVAGDGIVGWGATGGHHAAFIRERVAPLLVGQDLFAAERHAARLRQAAREAGGAANPLAVDLAQWDAIGKAVGQPLHRLWGVYAGRVPAYASTVAAKRLEERGDDALRYLEMGFQAIKLRAHYPTFEEDVAVVRLVRQAVGDRMAIMVDANQAGTNPATAGPDEVVWDLDRARRTADAYAEYGVTWLEEPLYRERLDDLARLCADATVPIAGGEGDRGLDRFRDLVERDCYDILQPDCTTSDGLFQLRKIAALAEVHGKPCIPHHGVGALGLAAHLQLSATLPNCPWVEYILDPPWRTVESYLGMWGIVPEPPRVEPDGCVPVPQGPGLGMAVDETALARWTVP